MRTLSRSRPKCAAPWRTGSVDFVEHNDARQRPPVSACEELHPGAPMESRVGRIRNSRNAQRYQRNCRA